MICPHCGAEHPESAGRFCENCGMSVIKLVKRERSEGEEKEVRTVRCRYCGVNAPPPICPACGQRLPIPDDWDDWEEE